MWTLLTLLACAPSPLPFGDDTATLAEAPPTLVIRPAEVTVTTGAGGADPVDFDVFQVLEDGTETPLDVVAWTLSNRSVGALDAQGVFTPGNRNGGAALVTAALDGATATASLSVIYEDEVRVNDVDPSLFAASGRRVMEDGWLYPPDEVVIPRNTPSLHFQWSDVGASAYRLTLRSALTRLDVYTTDHQWIADEATWLTVAATNSGGTVAMQLDAIVNGEQLSGPIRQIEVNRFDADGEIIYWSTSKAGLIEAPYGLPTRDFATQATTGHCVACHAVSRDGRVVFTYDGGNGQIGVKNQADASDIIGYNSGINGNFHTFSADGRYLVTAYRGALKLYDAATGAYLRDLINDGASTMPDWSLDDIAIVYVSADQRIEDWVLGGNTRIMVARHLGDAQFGVPRTLVTSPPGYRVYFPAISPDGKWVVYNQSTGDCVDDPDAELWVVPIDGSLEPIRLGNANLEGQQTNSWPRWGPLPDDDVMWLAFSSKRPYGFLTSTTPQIWLTRFDAQAAIEGRDPSSPAMWLPSQDVLTANHTPVWTE